MRLPSAAEGRRHVSKIWFASIATTPRPRSASASASAPRMIGGKLSCRPRYDEGVSNRHYFRIASFAPLMVSTSLHGSSGFTQLLAKSHSSFAASYGRKFPNEVPPSRVGP